MLHNLNNYLTLVWQTSALQWLYPSLYRLNVKNDLQRLGFYFGIFVPKFDHLQ